MRKKELEILFELLKNGRISDRDLAKKLNMSQSTVTRARHKLERKEIFSYIGIPNLKILNINLLAITFARFTNPTKEVIKKVKSFIEKNPKIIFSGEGEGMGKTTLILSLHKDFSDYSNFARSFRIESKGLAESVESFFVSTDTLARGLSLGRAVESIIKEEFEK